MKKTTNVSSTKEPQITGRISAGLDIGTTKVSVIIARVNPDKISYEIIGVGNCPSKGLRKGSVINIDITVDAIKKAREEAELMAGVKIDSVWVGVAGSHIRSFNSKGMVAIKNHEVAPDDVRRVLEAAKAVALPDDREILHLLPQSFAVDAQEGIRDPRGMSGVRLEAGVHLVTGAKMSLQNIAKCAERAGLHVSGLVLESLASAEAVLSQDEKDLGVAVVDMGGGTCDIIVYVAGAVVHTAVLPIGGMHLTQDISVGLRTPVVEAEIIKKKFGCAMTSLIDSGETIDVPSVGGRNPRTVSRATLTEVIEPRIEETLHLINNEILKSGYQELIGAGVVLAGGASCLDGIVELSEFIFEMPVRRGMALSTTGLKEVVQSPAYATGVGLMKYGAENSAKETAKKSGSLVERLKTSVADFLDGAF
ncbi:MAG: cell division protein FtsA [Oligoflexia bacterium]|nr:cell division protein FtsA [Oligoflexia bacterium]